MRRSSLVGSSSLQPQLAWMWLGESNPLRLLLLPGQTIPGPLRLLLAGVDRRNLPLGRQQWLWDPRPRLLAARSLAVSVMKAFQLAGGLANAPISLRW